MLLPALSRMIDTGVILGHPPLLYILMMHCELFSLKTWSSLERGKHLHLYETIGYLSTSSQESKTQVKKKK